MLQVTMVRKACNRLYNVSNLELKRVHFTRLEMLMTNIFKLPKIGSFCYQTLETEEATKKKDKGS